MGIDTGYWKGRRVFLTGHTGFKGGWLATWLSELGAKVTGYALKPSTDPSFFKLCGLSGRIESVMGDIMDVRTLQKAFSAARPEIVFHLAAQPLVRRSYRDPVGTLSVNILGTVNILEAIRKTASVKAAVVVTSDKCYENREWSRGYCEDDPMGGRDPYSVSKGCAELVTAAYRRSFFETSTRSVAIATVRAGNVIGGGDWSEDRIVPDAIRALADGVAINVRNPRSVRPWMHVLEPLCGYLMLAMRLAREGSRWSGGWNFGPENKHAVTVAQIAESLVRLWGAGTWEGTPDLKGTPHEASLLQLDSHKARSVLGWNPRLSVEQTLAMTIDWYRCALSGKDRSKEMYKKSCEQIRKYEALARSPVAV
ncbi:MAG: CDP-glucose 4,6-dehydratase [Elusimicrobiota bacterium]